MSGGDIELRQGERNREAMKLARYFMVNAEALKVAAVLAAVAACDSDEVSGPPGGVPASLAVSPDSVALTYLGETVQFTARVTGGTGSESAGTVRWESTAEAVLTVDRSGRVTARGNGTAEVRASVGNLSDAATVRVEQQVAALRVFGDGKRALPGFSLPGRVGVKVVDAGERAVAGTEVRFSVRAGGGSVDPETVVSDAEGLASAAWTVGPTLGEQKLSVTVAGVPEAEITARAVGPDSVVAQIDLEDGGGAGIDRTRRVRVRLADGAGRPVEGALATFSPGSDDGSVQPDSVRSDSRGWARTRWILGPAQRDYTLLVSSGEARLEVTATLLEPATAVREVMVQNWDRETAGAGQPLPVEVRLLGSAGRPVPGALVTFAPGASGGSVQPDSTRSGASGYASTVWRPGPSPGDYTLEVTSGAARLELEVTAVAPDSAAASVVLWSGGGQWGVAGEPLPEPVVAQVLDDAGAPVAGARVRFELRAGSGSVMPESVRSDSLGLVSTVWTLGATLGEQTLAVTVANESTLELTATAHPDAGVCGRTRAVIEALLRRTGVANCAGVTEEKLAAVQSLGLRRNNLRTLRSGDFSGLSKLRLLHLNENRLSALPTDIFLGLDALESLNLSHNELRALPRGTLANLPSLESLRLHDNQLTAIPSDVPELTRLEHLDLSRNPLAEVPSDVFVRMTRLETLHLAAIGLAELPLGMFQGLSRLSLLHLAGNRLTSLPPGIFDDLPELTFLSLYGNRLTELPPGVFRNQRRLRTLYLNSNELAQLPGNVFHELSDLETLRFDFNELPELPSDLFAGLSRLQYLNLTGNRLPELPPDIFNHLLRLRHLLLDSNRLTELPPNTFDGLENLEVLRLAANDLSELPPDIFEGLGSLADLMLESNGLSDLPTGAFRGLSNLVKLNLGSNPGEPFPVALELARTDTADLLAPGPANVVVRAPNGAPGSLQLSVSVQRGAASDENVTVAAGDTASATLVVTQSAANPGPVHVSLGIAPTWPPDFEGLEAVGGEPIVLFAPSANRTPVVVEVISEHWLQAGVQAKVELGAHFSDPDGDTLLYRVESNNDEMLSARVEGGVLVMDPLADGVAMVEVTATDPGGLGAALEVQVLVAPASDPDAYDIELIFGTGFSEEEKVIIRRAALRWTEVITGDVPDMSAESALYCSGNTPWPRMVGTVDDVVIFVSQSIHRANILGSAGVCGVRESGLTFRGSIWFNRLFFGPDAAPTGPNSMYVVALHEIGHVLGIGTSGWDRILRDPTTTDIPRDTYFPGPRAVEAFNEAGGRAYAGPKVPAENLTTLGANFHWRRSVLRGELMAPHGTILSSITVEALADMGYQVDASRADPYELPQADRVMTDPAVASEARFVDEIVDGPVFVVDETGKVVRIIRN